MSRQEEEEMEEEVGTMDCNSFNNIRSEVKLCDVLIKVDGAEFHAHKIILIGCSPYFMALFTNNLYPPDKYEYSIPGISSEIMELIMKYAYTQDVNITEENVCELLIAADYLAVSDLVNKCSMFLKAQLCVENCIGIWHFAHFYFCLNLKQQAFQFILHNFKEIVRVSEEFLVLTVEQLSEIIENDQLNVNQENKVFEAILQWIKHAPQDRKAHIGALLPKVRMELMTQKYFIDRVNNSVFVADDSAYKAEISRIQKRLYGLVPKTSLTFRVMRPRLPSGILLAIGGWNNGNPTNSIEAYDARADCWMTLPSNEESPRAYHGTAFLSGFVYCIGGFDGMDYFSSVRRFDPITRTWAQVGPMHSRRGYVSVCVLDGHIYAIGGYNGRSRLNTAERYEPETNQWKMIAPMHAQRSEAGATALTGKVYVCGGFDGNECLFTVECYSPQTDQWTFIHPMRNSRCGMGVIAWRGQVYAVGGFNGVNRLKSAEVYNPQSNLWRRMSPMIHERSNFGIEVVDDLLFVVGGHNGLITSNSVDCYDENTCEWHAVKDMGVKRSGLSCCVMSGLPNMAEYAAPRDEVPQTSGTLAGSHTAPANI